MGPTGPPAFAFLISSSRLLAGVHDGIIYTFENLREQTWDRTWSLRVIN